jgi:hypothetical protein
MAKVGVRAGRRRIRAGQAELDGLVHRLLKRQPLVVHERSYQPLDVGLQGHRRSHG